MSAAKVVSPSAKSESCAEENERRCLDWAREKMGTVTGLDGNARELDDAAWDSEDDDAGEGKSRELLRLVWHVQSGEELGREKRRLRPECLVHAGVSIESRFRARKVLGLAQSPADEVCET